MFELKTLIWVIFWAHLANGSHYGSRMRSEALAKSNIDGRVAAILNSGAELPGSYLSRFDRKRSETEFDQGFNNKKITKKYGMISPEQGINPNLDDDQEQIPIIEVNASDMPVSLIFRTNSPQINVQQKHNSEPAPEVESTRSEEEPHILKHEVYRPVIQELIEVIQPFRKFVQQVQPVIEDVQQVIASTGNRGRQTDSSMTTNSLTNFPTMGSSMGSNSYDSASTIQKGLFENLLAASPKRIGSMVRSGQNMDVQAKIETPAPLGKGVIETKPQTSLLLSQNLTQNSQKPNDFQNRYLSYGGVVDKMKMQASLRRLGFVVAPQMETVLAKPKGDFYEFQESTPSNIRHPSEKQILFAFV